MSTLPTVVAGVLLLAGCVAMGSKVVDHQTKCEKADPGFISMVACLKTSMGDMTTERDGDLLRGYLAEAGRLVLLVKRGKLDETAARYELDIRLATLQRVSADRDGLRLQRFGRGLQDAGNALQRAAPPPIVCTTTGPYEARTIICQ